MKQILKGTLFGLAALAATAPADAAILINVTEVGSDLVVTAEGSLDLASTAGLFATTSYSGSALFSSNGAGSVQSYTGIGPMDAYDLDWASVQLPATSPFTTSAVQLGGATGDPYLIDIAAASGYARIWMPAGYISGSIISTTTTFTGTSFASVGATEGVWEWSWSYAGGPTDSLILTVGEAGAEVPLPAAAWMLLSGLAALGLARRRNR